MLPNKSKSASVVNLKSEFDFINSKVKGDYESVIKAKTKSKTLLTHLFIDRKELERITTPDLEDEITNIGFYLEKDGILRIDSMHHRPMGKATYNPSVSEAIRSLQELEKVAVDLIKNFADSLK